MTSRGADARAFVYRGGVRIAGTVLACDASAGGELVFLSHAPALGARGRRALPHVGSGRRQLLATAETLALLGPAGDRLRTRALVAVYGRPFSLGDLRLEVFPSGLMPGAASLLCEGKGRRVVYAGLVGGGMDPEVRSADAVCLDARHAVEGARLPSRAEAQAAVGRAVREVLAAGGSPIVLADAPDISLAVGATLAADRIALRAHREVMLAAAACRRAGIPVPPLCRFAGRLGPGEVLLWPARVRVPARRRGGRAPGLVFVGPEAEAAARGRPGDLLTVTFPVSADFAGLLRYVEAAGASEVALVNAPGPDLHRALRARGIDAYLLGPPRQVDLFAADAA